MGDKFEAFPKNLEGRLAFAATTMSGIAADAAEVGRELEGVTLRIRVLGNYLVGLEEEIVRLGQASPAYVASIRGLDVEEEGGRDR